MNKISNEKQSGNFANTLLADAVFRPILFSTPMIQAILDGRKTQTRRIIKPQPSINGNQFSFIRNKDIGIFGPVKHISCGFMGIGSMAKYQIGDILWVRETFQPIEHPELKYRYKADHSNPKSVVWKPSIFMPKEACRIFLKVTNASVETLWDISEFDAIREGIEVIHLAEPQVPVYRNYLLKEKLGTINSKKSFRTLWESINGKQSWNKNPWVWVYDFERIERPLGFC